MARIFLTHIPDMLRNYYGERALSALKEHGEVRINDTGRVLDGPVSLMRTSPSALSAASARSP